MPQNTILWFEPQFPARENRPKDFSSGCRFSSSSIDARVSNGLRAQERAMTTLSETTRTTVDHRVIRLAAVVGTVATSTVIFVVSKAAGTSFTITDPGPGKLPMTFVAYQIAIFSAIFAVLGWLTLAALERWTSHPQRIWSILAVVVVLLSLVPIWIERADSGTRIMLAVIHVMVAVTLLPLPLSSRSTGRDARAQVSTD
jgi:hypothetical protein